MSDDELGILSRGELSEMNAVEPMIEDTLDMQTLAVLAGPWGTGKTFLALDWALSVATGRPWQDRHVHFNYGISLDESELVEGVHYDGDGLYDYAVPGGEPFTVWNRDPDAAAVLYVSAEGAHGLSARVAAWEANAGVKPVEGLFVLPKAVNLTDPKAVRRLTRIVEDEGVRLVVIDTLSRCMAGSDENSSKDMSTAVYHLDEIKEATGSCGSVLVVHHTGKDGRTVRGSSVLESAADTIYQIEPGKEGLTLVRTKRKDGPTPDVHQLRLRPAHGSCVVDRATGQDAEGLGPIELDVLSVAVNVCKAGRPSRTELRDAVVDGTEVGRARAYQAIKTLVDTGHLVNVGSEFRPQFEVSAQGIEASGASMDASGSSIASIQSANHSTSQ